MYLRAHSLIVHLWLSAFPEHVMIFTKLGKFGFLLPSILQLLVHIATLKINVAIADCWQLKK